MRPVSLATEPTHFDPALVADLDEPVRRYFTHALAPGAPLARGVHLTMKGRIKVGPWLPFTATWEGDGVSFTWRAKAGPLRVVDRYADGTACMDVRLGRLPLVHAHDDDVGLGVPGQHRGGIGHAARLVEPPAARRMPHPPGASHRGG